MGFFYLGKGSTSNVTGEAPLSNGFSLPPEEEKEEGPIAPKDVPEDKTNPEGDFHSVYPDVSSQIDRIEQKIIALSTSMSDLESKSSSVFTPTNSESDKNKILSLSQEIEKVKEGLKTLQDAFNELTGQ